MKLSKKLSGKEFLIYNLVILFSGFIFLGSLNYVLNIQYNESNKPFKFGPVTTLPKSLRMDLDQPAEDTLSFSNSAVVSGQTTPLREILISTQDNDLVIKSKTDGSFSTVINLKEGVNQISVTVFDANGETRTLERTVYYSKEKI